MILLMRLGRNNWVVSFELDGIVERCDEDTAIAMLRSFGISFEEIMKAMTLVISNSETPVAEFGLNRTFVCTRSCEDPTQLVA